MAMGFFDKIKGAVQAVTGGAATVEITYAERATAGSTVAVKVTVTSKGSEIKSKGVFVDFAGHEQVHVNKKDDAKLTEDLRVGAQHSAQEFQIAPALTLGAGESKSFEGTIQLPPTLQPTFAGRYTQNNYQLRGRLEATGNDPDSGWKPLRVLAS
jgi:hypothetical protein